MKIVAFTGKKQTGKSTACAYLEEKYSFTRVNFKDALIAELKENFPELLGAILKVQNDYIDEFGPFEQVQNILGKDYIDTIDELFVVKPPLMRTLMQNYGTNVRRKEKDSYWVDEWVKTLWEKGSDTKTTVDDVRFLNEASRVKGQGGIIIRLIRTDMQHTDTHQSETEMDSIVPDFTITCNGGDYDHLYKELDTIMTK